jgi:hypothetical protein
MKKKLYICVLFLTISLVCSSCKSNSGDSLTRSVPSFHPHANNIFSPVSEREKTIFENIPKENFDTMHQPFKIKYINRNHYYYGYPNEDYVVSECVLYAVVRALYHLGKLGRIDPDLWKKHSIQELRNILADISGEDRVRKMGIWLDNFHIRAMLFHFLGNSERCIILICNDNEIDDLNLKTADRILMQESGYFDN